MNKHKGYEFNNKNIKSEENYKKQKDNNKGDKKLDVRKKEYTKLNVKKKDYNNWEDSNKLKD